MKKEYLPDFVNENVKILIRGKGFHAEVSGILIKDGFEYRVGDFCVQQYKAQEIMFHNISDGFSYFIFLAQSW